MMYGGSLCGGASRRDWRWPSWSAGSDGDNARAAICTAHLLIAPISVTGNRRFEQDAHAMLAALMEEGAEHKGLVRGKVNTSTGEFTGLHYVIGASVDLVVGDTCLM